MAAKTAGTWKALSDFGIPDLTTVDTTQQFPLGKKITARDVGSTAYGDAEFMYASGVTSTARGSVVVFSAARGTALVAADLIGQVGIALAAVDASTKFGWYQISGKGVALCDTVADAAQCLIDGTAGRIDDAASAGNQVIGMFTASTDDTNTCLVVIPGYAFVANTDA
jgi:hypothetical protein